MLARSLVEEPYSGARIESLAAGNQYGARCSAFPLLPANAGLWPGQREDSESVFERGRRSMTWEPSRAIGTHWLRRELNFNAGLQPLFTSMLRTGPAVVEASLQNRFWRYDVG